MRALAAVPVRLLTWVVILLCLPLWLLEWQSRRISTVLYRSGAYPLMVIARRIMKQPLWQPHDLKIGIPCPECEKMPFVYVLEGREDGPQMQMLCEACAKRYRESA